MAGMRALGRVYDVVPAAAAATALTVCLKDCSGVGIVASTGATATGTLTFTARKTFSGSQANVTPANGFGQPNTWYLRHPANTAAWAAQAANWGGPPATNVLTISAVSGDVSYVDYLVSELADTYDYLTVTPGAAVTITAILYDLLVARTPANLRIPSA